MTVSLHKTVGNIILAGLALLTVAMVWLIFMVLSQDVQAQYDSEADRYPYDPMASFEKRRIREADKCDFYREGFRDGYCVDRIGVCVAPQPPVCTDWKVDNLSPAGAYNKGFRDGEARGTFPTYE